MLRPKTLVLAGAFALALTGLAGPAAAAPVRTYEAGPAETCIEPDHHGVARGRDGEERALDHRAVSAAEQRQIDERTSRILAAKGPRAGRPAGDIVVPVYVHVMAAADGTGDVTDEQIDQQIAVLDKTFGGGESPDAAVTGFDFELAGVDRFFNDMWHNDKQSNKYRKATRQGGPEALNIWLVEFGYLGVAQFPWDYDKAAGTDGIRVLWSSLPGGSERNYNEGDTATHETGHWLGLFHTFQGGCKGAGDEVDDTPAQSVATNGCPEGQDSCPADGLDPIHNYMDYSYDSCYDQFTPGQATRMQDMWAAYRAG